MAMQKNWFDNAFEESFRPPQCATVDQKVEAALQSLAAMSRIREELHRAIYDYEQYAGKKGWAGPTFSQLVRQTVAASISAMPDDTGQDDEWKVID